MSTLSALLLENGLPNLPVLLVEPHRNRERVWRIKFSYDTAEPLSIMAVFPAIANRSRKIELTVSRGMPSSMLIFSIASTPS
jgi:hypothetical protein